MATAGVAAASAFTGGLSAIWAKTLSVLALAGGTSVPAQVAPAVQSNMVSNLAIAAMLVIIIGLVYRSRKHHV